MTNLHVTGTGTRTNNYKDNLDFYKTPIWAVEALLIREQLNGDILDPCCGDGVIAECLKGNSRNITAIDLADRGYGIGGINYLNHEGEYDAVVMNPPFKLLQPFIERALEQTRARNGKVALISRLAVLEGKSRKAMFEKYPPSDVYVFSSRVNFIGPDGKEIPSAMAVCWTVWDWKYDGPTKLGWI